MTKVFDFDALTKVNISEETKIQWVDSALRIKDQVLLPAKLSLKPEKEVFFNVMPTVIPSLNVAGVKVVNRYPKRNPALDSQIMLYDLVSGKLKAIMDGNYITTARTGSVAAHSVKIFAKNNFSGIGFIGLGNQARSAAKAILSEFQNQEIKINLYAYKKQEYDFIDYLRQLPQAEKITINILQSVDEIFQQSDVVVSSLTYADHDLLLDQQLMHPGTLLIPIHTRGFMNLDTAVDRVYCDDINQVSGFKYFKKFNSLAEVSDVLITPSLGRHNDDERIIVYNIGLALHDIYFAAKIFEKMEESSMVEVNLGVPQEKVWYW